MKDAHRKALEQYVFVAYHLKGMTLADWWKLDDEERAYMVELIDQWLSSTSAEPGPATGGHTAD